MNALQYQNLFKLTSPIKFIDPSLNPHLLLFVQKLMKCQFVVFLFSELISQGNPNLRIGGEKSSQLETPIQENKLLQANKNSE